MKESPSYQRKESGPSAVETQVPTPPANAWLAAVATRIPQAIGQGLRNRAASTKPSNCVLSPISASATMLVETRNASIKRC